MIEWHPHRILIVEGLGLVRDGISHVFACSCGGEQKGRSTYDDIPPLPPKAVSTQA